MSVIQASSCIGEIDPSLGPCPSIPGAAEKDHSYRDYSESSGRFDTVSNLYLNNHTFQTVEYNEKQREKFNPLNRLKLGIWDAFELLEEIIDESDPDLNGNQVIHALQTSEKIREKYPDEKYDWLVLVGFIHDMGKILAHPVIGEPQWSVVGDTFPVGCKFAEKIVWNQHFKTNVDLNHPVYSTVNGVYKEGCGLDNLNMSWGHDEYMYRVCIGNGCLLPSEALYIIRFHSFYPWHHAGAYKHFMNEKDIQMLPLVQEFQKCDLYSKSDDPNKTPDLQKLKPYYDSLIKKYFPNQVLRW